MAAIISSLEQLIGGTPLAELSRLRAALALNVRLLGKLEYFNPTGSVKDRAALSMILDAEAQGTLRPGSIIIEPTSGNTGIGLAAVAAVRGYRTIIVMPDTMSQERRQLMAAYGAELVLTPGALGMDGAIAQAEALAAQTPNSWIPGQFENPANAQAHWDTTGPELYQALGGDIDLFVAGVGTGGTITGTGRYLKAQCPSIQVAAVEPAASPVLSGGNKGPHGLQGIGSGFIPQVLDRSVCDRIVPVTEEDAFQMARLLARTEGYLVGISSGAALAAAVALAREPVFQNKTIVALLPDGGSRYLSTSLFS